MPPAPTATRKPPSPSSRPGRRPKPCTSTACWKSRAFRAVPDPLPPRRIQLRRRRGRRPHPGQPDGAPPGRALAQLQGRRQAHPGHLQRLPGDDQVRRAVAAARRQSGPPATLTLERLGPLRGPLGAAGVNGRSACSSRGIESMYLPVAHAEGKFVTRDAAALDQLDAAGQLVLRYAAQRRGRRSASVSRQSQRLDGRRGRALRHDRPRSRPDAAPRAAYRPYAASPLDPRRSRPGGRRLPGVCQRGGLLPY